MSFVAYTLLPISTAHFGPIFTCPPFYLASVYTLFFVSEYCAEGLEMGPAPSGLFLVPDSSDLVFAFEGVEVELPENDVTITVALATDTVLNTFTVVSSDTTTVKLVQLDVSEDGTEMEIPLEGVTRLLHCNCMRSKMITWKKLGHLM